MEDLIDMQYIPSYNHEDLVNIVRNLLEHITYSDGPFQRSDYAQQVFMKLIDLQINFTTMCTLEHFFTSLFDQHPRDYTAQRNFFSYCAEARQKLDQYFLHHFEHLLEQYVI